MIGDPSLSFFRFINIFVTPLTAPVGCPFEVLNGGMAWKALYRYEDPSMIKILFFMFTFHMMYYDSCFSIMEKFREKCTKKYQNL